MKIAIPLAGGRLCMHFGHCQQFALVEVTDGAICDIVCHEPPAHEPGALPAWLREQGADVVITGGMGRRAQMLFDQAGIEVVVGAPAAEPRALVRDYLDGSLQTGKNVCDH